MKQLDGRNRTMRYYALSGHAAGRVGSADTSARYGRGHAVLFATARSFWTVRSRSQSSMWTRLDSIKSGRTGFWTRSRHSPGLPRDRIRLLLHSHAFGTEHLPAWDHQRRAGHGPELPGRSSAIESPLPCGRLNRT